MTRTKSHRGSRRASGVLSETPEETNDKRENKINQSTEGRELARRAMQREFEQAYGAANDDRRRDAYRSRKSFKNPER